MMMMMMMMIIIMMLIGLFEEACLCEAAMRGLQRRLHGAKYGKKSPQHNSRNANFKTCLKP